MPERLRTIPNMRKNLLSILILLGLCALAARLTLRSGPRRLPSLEYGERSLLARLPSGNLTIAGVALNMSKTALLKSLGRPASYSKVRQGALLTFAGVQVILASDMVIWVRGTELEQDGQSVRAGGDPDEVMQGIPGFEVVELAKDGRRGGLTTLYWPESNLRSDTVFATDAWYKEYALGREPLIRERPPGGQRLYSF